MFVFTVLHPRHKLRYFQDAGWEDDWIAMASRIVRDRFETGYRTVQPTDEARAESKVESTSQNMFDDLPALAAPKLADLRDELDRFLSSDPEFVPDVLAWWHERRNVYPRLSRMAMDYLSIPGELSFTMATRTSTNHLGSNICRCRARLQQGPNSFVTPSLSSVGPVNARVDVCRLMESIGFCEG
jgi:hypothetical protein